MNATVIAPHHNTATLFLIAWMLPALQTDHALAAPSDAAPLERLGLRGAVEPVLRQDGEAWGNLHGGRRRGAAYTGVLTFGLHADLDALGWVSGASLGIHGLWLQGENISPEAVGDAGIVSNIAGDSTVRLFKWWWLQRWDRPDIELKVGQIPLDDDFMFLESAQLFINSGFGTPQTEALNMPAPIYPFGALGARLAVEPSSRWQMLFGIYDGDAGDPRDNAHASDLVLNVDQGATWLAEVSWYPDGDDDQRVAAGGIAHLGTVQDYERNVSARGLSNVYVMTEHALARWNGSEVTLFGHAAFSAPADQSVVTSYVDVGSVLTGGAWGRDGDRLGLGFASTQFGDAYVARQEAMGSPVSPAEHVLELTYRLRFLRWAFLQPDGQWVIQPHFSEADAWVVGLRLSIEP